MLFLLVHWCCICSLYRAHVGARAAG